MGRKNKKCSKIKPPRKEALRCWSDDVAAARLAERHVLGHVLGQPHEALDPACSRGGGLAASSPQARVAAVRQRLLGVRADAEALAAAATGAGDATDAAVLLPSRHRAGRRGDETQDLLTVSVADLTVHCGRSGSARGLVGAVEFAICEGHERVGVLAVS
ncbi:hypothetical protein EJB05_27650, partial [Eragrostis curvula]